MTRLAWAIPFLVLAGCAWALRRQARAAAMRARWAWRCRGHPARPDDGAPLDRAEFCAFVGLVETWRQSGAPERSRA